MSLANQNYRLRKKSKPRKKAHIHHDVASFKKKDSNRMNVLMLAPHPFYQNRGTPIAVDLVLKVLSKRGDRVDVVTYPEGCDIYYENVSIHRIPKLPFIRNIRPGFSGKKVICDIFMAFKVIRLISTKQYDLVHAGEEAVFIGLFLKIFLRIPYVYDMDSSLAQQMVEKYPNLKFLVALLEFCEGIAVKHAKVVVAVCDALAIDIQKYKPKNVVVIPDISLLNQN